MGHFISSPREREKRDRRDEKEEQRRKKNRNESAETEEIQTLPLYPYLLQGKQALPNCKPISVGRPGDVRYTSSHHPTIPGQLVKYHSCLQCTLQLIHTNLDFVKIFHVVMMFHMMLQPGFEAKTDRNISVRSYRAAMSYFNEPQFHSQSIKNTQNVWLRYEQKFIVL